MSNETPIVYTEDQMWEYIRLHPFNVFLLEGDLGAGKTTWVSQYLNRILGMNIHVTSPTYTLCHWYQHENLLIAHIDAYRLSPHAPVAELFDHPLKKPAFFFIEWWNRIPLDKWMDLWASEEHWLAKPVVIYIKPVELKRLYQISPLKLDPKLIATISNL